MNVAFTNEQAERIALAAAYHGTDANTFVVDIIGVVVSEAARKQPTLSTILKVAGVKGQGI